MESKLESSCFQIVCSCSVDASDSQPSTSDYCSLTAFQTPEDSSAPAAASNNSGLKSVDVSDSFIFASSLSFAGDPTSNSYAKAADCFVTATNEAALSSSSNHSYAPMLSVPAVHSSNSCATTADCCSADRDSSLARSCSLEYTGDSQKDSNDDITAPGDFDDCTVVATGCSDEETGGDSTDHQADAKSGSGVLADCGDLDALVEGSGLANISDKVANTLKDAQV